MIYVLCPADVKTGGTELLHQLVKTLTDVKVPAGIVYTEISEEHPGMNPAFLEYTDGYLREEEIEDEKGNILHKSFYKLNGSKNGFIKNIVKNSYLGCTMAFNKKIFGKNGL